MKTMLQLVLALAAVIAFPAPQARAQSAPPPPGHLRAAGNGVVHVAAAGQVEFRLHGQGVLVVQDAAQFQIALVGQGVVHQTTAGDLVVQGFQGRVTVVGRGIQADFKKGRVGVVADGKGMARFQGKGLYWANGVAGKWTPPGTPVPTVGW